MVTGWDGRARCDNNVFRTGAPAALADRPSRQPVVAHESCELIQVGVSGNTAAQSQETQAQCCNVCDSVGMVCVEFPLTCLCTLGAAGSCVRCLSLHRDGEQTHQLSKHLRTSLVRATHACMHVLLCLKGVLSGGEVVFEIKGGVPRPSSHTSVTTRRIIMCPPNFSSCGVTSAIINACMRC